MFGSGIGELNVYIRAIGGSAADRKIWGLSGDAGNNWYMAQAPVASSKPFKVSMKRSQYVCLYQISVLKFAKKKN